MPKRYTVEISAEPTSRVTPFGPVSLMIWEVKNPDGRTVFADPEWAVMNRVRLQLERAHRAQA